MDWYGITIRNEVNRKRMKEKSYPNIIRPVDSIATANVIIFGIEIYIKLNMKK